MQRDYKVYLNGILTSNSKIERYVNDLSFQELELEGISCRCWSGP